MVLTYVLDDKGEMIILIDQFPFPILNHKTKVRLQFLTLAGVRFDRC